LQKKILIAYFSCSGVTRKTAELIANKVNGDLFEIEPVTPYTSCDLDWTDKESRSTIEMKDLEFRPPIKKKADNIEAYNVIFIGFPIWWYIAPTIINTFLESYDFSGKTIIPFATSGGSGLGKTEENLQGSCSDTVIWKPAKLVKSLSKTIDMDEWLGSLQL